MVREISKAQRRLLVAINYVSLAVIVFMVHVGRPQNWDVRQVLAGAVPAAAVLAATFIAVFWRTGLWKIAHASFEKIDERQVQLMYESIRRSYTVFALLCVVILFANAVAERGHIPILIAAGLLYLAHTLPAAAVAWSEKEVFVGD
jgi:hypothetical protein